MCSHVMRLGALVLAFAAAVLPMTQTSSAIGISPGRVEMDFSPGRNSTHDIYIIGGDFPEITVKSRQSDTCGLTDYIVPEKTELSLEPGEKTYMKVYVSLPLDYPSPGLHQCAIIAEEVPQTGYSGVAAFSAVQTQIWIRVPYPARYLSGSLSAPNVNLSGTAHFTLFLDSLGLEGVTASSVITVTDSSGRTVATLQTGSTTIESMGRGTLEASWDTAGMPAGRYRATAVVDYGAEKPLVIDSEFKIGDILIKILNVTYPSEINPDDIVKIEALVDSYWNERIEDAYISMEASKDGVSGGVRRSESFDLDPWESKVVPIYWDTGGLEPGTYVAQVSVHYAGRTESGITNLEIKAPGNPYTIYLAFIVVIAAVLAILYLMIRRRQKSRGARQ